MVQIGCTLNWKFQIQYFISVWYSFFYTNDFMRIWPYLKSMKMILLSNLAKSFQKLRPRKIETFWPPLSSIIISYYHYFILSLLLLLLSSLLLFRQVLLHLQLSPINKRLVLYKIVLCTFCLSKYYVLYSNTGYT